MNNLNNKLKYLFIFLFITALSLIGCVLETKASPEYLGTQSSQEYLGTQSLPECPEMPSPSKYYIKKPLPEYYETQSPPEYHVWDTLTKVGVEKTGYAMYTYVLFGRRVSKYLNSKTSDRYESLLAAIIGSTPSVEETSEWPKEVSNIFYIPGIRTDIYIETSSSQLLDNYNSSLAMKYITKLSIAVKDSKFQQRIIQRPGPFLISTLYPLKQLNNSAVVFYADLSKTNPAAMQEIVNAYKDHIIHQKTAEIERFNLLRLSLLNFILDTDYNLKIIRVALNNWYPEKQ